MTVRKQIADAIHAALSAIQTGNGYATTITTVERWRDVEAAPFEAEELPAVNFRDGRAPVVHQLSQDEHALEVDIDIITTSAVTAADALDYVGDIVKCLADNGTWGGLADGTTIESHEIAVGEGEEVVTCGRVKTTVNYTTDMGRI